MKRLTIKIKLVVSLLIVVTIYNSCEKNPISSQPPKEVGPEWIIYTTKNSSLVDNRINTVYVDPTNIKWVGTDNGVSRFNKDNWLKIQKYVEFSVKGGTSRKVNAIVASKDGGIFYGLAGGGLRRSNQFAGVNSFTSYNYPTLSSDMVYSLATDNQGHIWIGTGAGVTRFIPNASDPTTGNWRSYDSSSSIIPSEPIKCITINNNDNSIWFGTYTLGVVSYDGDMDWNFSMPSDQPFPILAMGFTFGNVGWFGTYGDWAYKYIVSTNEWIQYGDTSSGGNLPGYIVNAIAIDPSGVPWFGTNKGLTKLNGKTWDASNSPLPSNIVTSLAFDKKGNLWIGTANGLAEFNEKGIVE